MPVTQYVSQVMLTGGTFNWRGTVPCTGGTAPSDNLLNSLIGTTFGGEAPNSIGIPDLRDTIMTGVSPSMPLGSRVSLASGSDFETVGLTSMMAVEGRAPNASNETYFLGDIILLASSAQSWVDTEWLMPCDGRLMSISQNWALYNVIGTTYGGDGQNVFSLPDLRNATVQFPYGYGNVGQGSGPISAVALTFAIVIVGPYPSKD